MSDLALSAPARHEEIARYLQEPANCGPTPAHALGPANGERSAAQPSAGARDVRAPRCSLALRQAAIVWDGHSAGRDALLAPGANAPSVQMPNPLDASQRVLLMIRDQARDALVDDVGTD